MEKIFKRFSREWINAYDAGQVLTMKKLYDLKAMPTLYLLGKNKVVLLKDINVTQIIQFLSNL